MAPQRRDVPPGAAATKKAAVVCALGQWPRADGTSYGTKTQIAPTVGRSSPETASQALPQQARGTLDARLASTEAGCASSPVGENAATVEWFGLFPRLASRCCRGCRQASPRRRGQCPGEALRCVGAGAARPSAGATPRARGKGRRTPHNPTAKRARPFPARLGGRADGHRAAWARVALARRAWRRSGTHAPASAGLGALSPPACRRHRRSVGGSGSASARRRRLQRIAGAGWRPLGWKWLASRPAGDAVGPRRVRWHKQEASEASARHACTWQAVAVGLLARLPRSVGALHGVARCACVCSGCERCD